MKLKLKSVNPGSLGIKMYEKLHDGWIVIKPARKTFWGFWVVTLEKEL